MVNGFDIETFIKSTIDKILKTNVLLILCTDSKFLFDCLIKLNTTQEKRFIINVIYLKEAYEQRDIVKVK